MSGYILLEHKAYVGTFTLLEIPVIILVLITAIRIGLSLANGNKVGIKDLYPVFTDFWRYAGGLLLFAIIFTGGLFLLIVPGIIWAAKYQFFAFLIIEHGVSPTQAITRSGQITSGAKGKILLFDLPYAVLPPLNFIPISGLQCALDFLQPIFIALFLWAMASVYIELLSTETPSRQAKALKAIVDHPVRGRNYSD